jgi:hypothetical protein
VVGAWDIFKVGWMIKRARKNQALVDRGVGCAAGRVRGVVNLIVSNSVRLPRLEVGTVITGTGSNFGIKVGVEEARKNRASVDQGVG